jgi:hypothetical protein
VSPFWLLAQDGNECALVSSVFAPCYMEIQGQEPDWSKCDRVMEIREQQWKPKDPYRDDRYPERACDKCGKSYRGPAVYCSLECATKDA